ncbi:MAG: hypothetical protein JW828_16830 [Sedimentisphaerales bacterium]|nr:hypothetical protein [Sedimentisphaerales bacterium]
MRFFTVLGFCFSLLSLARGGEEVRFDFESGDLQGWRIVEGQFGKVITDRAVFHNTSDPYNKQGQWFLSTLEREDNRPNDGFVGIIESPLFTIEGNHASLLVGGGGNTDIYKPVHVVLCREDGKEILFAFGQNTEPMHRVDWDLTGLDRTERYYLRIEDRNTGGWGHITLDDFRVAGRIDPEASSRRFAREQGIRNLKAFVHSLDLDSLRWAVKDLVETFPQQYEPGPEAIRQMDRYQSLFVEHEISYGTDLTYWERLVKETGKQAEQFRRDMLLANPLLSDHPILFVVRSQYRPDHHNTATLFQTEEINASSFVGGAALKLFDVKTGKVQTLLETVAGVIRDPDVHFDGTRILFSMRRDIRDPYHIYEINSDGSGLKQLTFADGISDIDPVYLPDDTIVFSSTREPKYCMCNRHIMANLFRMEADGANIHQIGKSTLFEGHGSLLPDGRLLYDRWEYVDRNFGDAQGLWTVNPDGTNHAIYWGNNTASPGAVIDAREINGAQQVVCTFSSCHDRPWGAMAIIDRRLALDGRPGVVRTWPADAVDLVDRGDFDMFQKVHPKYEDPYPLSEKYFLCSRMTGNGEQMGIYLIDVFGNQLLLHTEEPGCFDPMPLRPRPCPPTIPSRRDFHNAYGTFYVANVYEGTHMVGVKPGEVKSLRVVESPEKRFWTTPPWNGQGQQAPAMAWHDFNNKRILGTVPVEEDGSAYFEVPADRFVYFQLLDKDGMMIQSMRSGTMVQSGETTGCVGCHENRHIAPTPAIRKIPLALRREPAPMAGWYGNPRLFSYIDEVQPVFDRHCIRCHDFNKEGAGKLVLAGDRDNTFNVSYNELWRKKYIAAIGAGPHEIQQAYSWGSHKSRLVEVIREKYKEGELDKESFDRIVTWIDINAPYYSTYASAYPDNLAGRSPLNQRQLKRLGELVGLDFYHLAGYNTNTGPQICFERPERSPCLSRMDPIRTEAYAEALTIIRTGQAMLQRRPRADMAGFVPSPIDSERQMRYAKRRQIEMANRQAIRLGNNRYDCENPPKPAGGE